MRSGTPDEDTRVRNTVTYKTSQGSLLDASFSCNGAKIAQPKKRTLDFRFAASRLCLVSAVIAWKFLDTVLANELMGTLA
jgi:hypothetical protein